MTLSWIAILLGSLATIIGCIGLISPEKMREYILRFPRSTIPAWILLLLCCFLGAQEALKMNMGFLNEYKTAIYFIAPAVFVAALIYMKELLAPRVLGGFLLLIAVPILRVARLSGAPYFQVISTLVYLWIIYGLILLLSPWYFRILNRPLVESPLRLKIALSGKILLGLVLIGLGLFVY
jgi:hypothetical protein